MGRSIISLYSGKMHLIADGAGQTILPLVAWNETTGSALTIWGGANFDTGFSVWGGNGGRIFTAGATASLRAPGTDLALSAWNKTTGTLMANIEVECHREMIWLMAYGVMAKVFFTAGLQPVMGSPIFWLSHGMKRPAFACGIQRGAGLVMVRFEWRNASENENGVNIWER